MQGSAWLFAALYFPALQVLPLYLFHSLPRSEAILQRMAATAVAACAAGWLPTARLLAQAAAGGAAATGQAPDDPPMPLAAALGLRTPGLLAACALPLALTALLFAGPLLALALSWQRCSSRHSGHRMHRMHSSSHVGGSPSAELWARRVSSLPPAVALRNWVAAPLLEEFLFRSCLISYLLAAGATPARCVLLSPLLFAACHLHHLYDLLRFQRLPLALAARQVVFQLCYTSLFGALAALFFVRSRHLAAAVLPHAFCNLLGPPALPLPGSPGRRAVAAALAGGIAGFLCLLRPLTDPRLFANSAAGS